MKSWRVWSYAAQIVVCTVTLVVIDLDPIGVGLVCVAIGVSAGGLGDELSGVAPAGRAALDRKRRS